MPDDMSASSAWEEELLSSFLAMVKAKDGDFQVLTKLDHATRDQESFVLMHRKLLAEPGVEEAFQKKALLGRTDFAELHKLPTNTLGYLYADHMIRNQLNQLKPLNDKTAADTTDDYRFMALHLGETHDIWHVISNSDTTILGEIKVAAFSAAQIHTSRFWFALLSKNILKATLYDIESATIYLDIATTGWVMGRRAKSIFGVDWREWWTTPIDEVRQAFGVVEFEI